MSLREAAQQALVCVVCVHDMAVHPDERMRDMAVHPDSVQMFENTITALRTALAEPERKPLTDEEIGKIILETEITLKNYCDVDLQTAFARRIERAHGIGGEA
jgi:hypothetical protein